MIVVIDSTEYKQDRTFKKRNIALIKDYGKHKLIDLHIPYIVYMEVLTTIANELTQEVNQIKNMLLGLESKGLSPVDTKYAKSITKNLEAILPNIEKSSEKLLNDFIKDANGTLHPLYEADATPVFDAYFKGEKPFKILKSRVDIPDAFIYQTILRLRDKKKQIHVISNDKNLRESFEGEANIKTHTSLVQFLNSADFKKLEVKFKEKVHYEAIEKSKSLIMDFKYVFEEAMQSYVSTVQYLEIYETGLPTDGGEATIKAIDLDKIIIEKDKIEFINDSFYIPIFAKGEASVDFFVDKHEYWSSEHLSGTEWNEWVYLCEDVFPVEMTKTVIIHKDDFNEDLEPLVEIDDFDDFEVEFGHYSTYTNSKFRP